MKPLLLDLFSGAGGAARGYQQAGFYVVGVDINPQPRYAGDEFHQADALEFIAAHGHEFDVIHASPKCQFGTGMQHLGKARNGSYPQHENQIPAVRELLNQTGRPYIIENVDGSRKHLINPIMLCGNSFGLKTYRHRWFELSPFWFLAPSHTAHLDQTPSAGNGKSPKGFISICGTGGVRGMTSQEIVDYWGMAMGIDWMTREELKEAIPPKYTEWLGKQLLRVIGCTNANPVL
jgi:DNA (cytosine-5)-methyltransferase 1